VSIVFENERLAGIKDTLLFLAAALFGLGLGLALEWGAARPASAKGRKRATGR